MKGTSDATKLRDSIRKLSESPRRLVRYEVWGASFVSNPLGFENSSRIGIRGPFLHGLEPVSVEDHGHCERHSMVRSSRPHYQGSF